MGWNSSSSAWNKVTSLWINHRNKL
jgi:hypothetical protein